MTRSAERVHMTVLSLDHPTADDVYLAMRSAGDTIGRATVYRSLTHLVESGRLRVRELGEQNRYDPHIEPHIHIHDAATGRLLDLPMSTKLREALAEVAADVLETQDDCIIELKGRLRPGVTQGDTP